MAIGNSQGGRSTGDKDASGRMISVPFRPWDYFPLLKPPGALDDGRVLTPASDDQDQRDEQISGALTQWLGMAQHAAAERKAGR